MTTVATPEVTNAAAAPTEADGISLADIAKAHDVRFLLATFVDMTGKPCAKLVPVEAAEELENGSMGFAGYAAGLIGQKPQDSDLVAMPDLASFTPVPFIREGLAIIHCDPHVDGKPWPYAPRVILKNTLARLADKGIQAKIGAEVEYFLVTKNPDGTLSTADASDDSPRPCYDARGVTRMYEHLTSISEAMNSLGWGNYANDHEDAAGQFEQNFNYADALTTADRVVTLRYILNILAEQRGMTVTFMPKPFMDRTGTGLHLHLSLWSGADPLFPGENDPKGLGLSELAYSFIGGVLQHAPALQAFLAPTVNSYKRTGATTSSSGATWSPRKASFGGNDRTHMIRVPDNKRIELRSGDGSANPYLAIATAIEAGMDGVGTNIDPGLPSGPGESRADAHQLPATLLHAVEALREDPVVLASLSCDEEIGRYYAAAKEEEFLTWHNQVSDWEIRNYLTSI
ncbi:MULTISPECIES: type III glutamate--ammonia ligase [Arthrobacter]|uniref:Type III glutamate--ammonia ligase n=1 Tax=Arthrobacter terricola TaxID=2547396 RepID=A0A4R5KS56_9MICC|nr:MULTISPECIES: type III glutamate--ammonia ligase [Arthrobacter]MBT8160706.1 type III glutamate--ammonia ligase [Arthrobacter sp. GN70]TDF97858.1 type III glutamate--ammonia ligase [Arthrobacter terricola]